MVSWRTGQAANMVRYVWVLILRDLAYPDQNPYPSLIYNDPDWLNLTLYLLWIVCGGFSVFLVCQNPILLSCCLDAACWFAVSLSQEERCWALYREKKSSNDISPPQNQTGVSLCWRTILLNCCLPNWGSAGTSCMPPWCYLVLREMLGPSCVDLPASKSNTITSDQLTSLLLQLAQRAAT